MTSAMATHESESEVKSPVQPTALVWACSSAFHGMRAKGNSHRTEKKRIEQAIVGIHESKEKDASWTYNITELIK